MVHEFYFLSTVKKGLKLISKRKSKKKKTAVNFIASNIDNN